MSRGEVRTDAYPGLGRLAFFHFCRALSPATLSPLRFVESLSLELAARYPAFALALTRVGHDRIAISTSQTVGRAEAGAQIAGVVIHELHIGDISAQDAFDRLVRRPLEAICTDDFAETIVLLVDSLDEALTYRDENIVTVLAEMGELPRQVRWLLTSRPDRRILDRIGRPALQLIEDAPDDVDDVRDYAYRRLHSLSEPDRTVLADRVAVAGEGNFLYARYVLDDLVANIGQLDDVRYLVLPDRLEDIYRQFLRRELARTQELWEARYRPLLGAVAVARGEGLTRTQLAGITSLPQSTTDDILRICNQYLEGPYPEGPFRIYHQSFREFLVEDPTYLVYPAESNQAIAEYFLAECERRWAACDPYALRYTPAHLRDAVEQAEQRRVKHGLADAAGRLLTDLEFLEAKTAGIGIDAVLDDLRGGTGLSVEEGGTPPEVGSWLTLLDTQAHHLQGWDRTKDPGFFAQQVHIQAAESGAMDLAARAADTLAHRNRPYFTSAWRAGWWDGRGGKRTLTGHTDIVFAVAMTPDGRRVVSGSNDNTLKVWDIETGRELRTLTGHTDWVHAVVVTGDGRYAVSGSFDGTVKVWELETGRLVATLAGHRGQVNGVAVSADGHVAVSGSSDGTLCVWDLVRQRQLRVLTVGGGGIKGVALTPDGRYAVSGSDELTLWDLSTGEVVRSMDVDGAWVEAVAVTDDGRYAISGEQELTAWDLKTGHPLRRFTGHTSWVNGIAINPQRPHMITGSSDGTLKVWDLETGEMLRTLALGIAVACVAVSPDGRTAVSGGWDAALTIWDLEAGAEEHVPAGHREAVDGVVVSPDRPWAVSASQDHTLKVWDLTAGTELRTLRGHEEWVTAVALLPQQEQVISGDVHGVLIVWDLRTGRTLRTIDAHDAAVRAIAVFPDARRAVSGSNDNTMKIWDLETGRLLQTLTSRKAEVTAAALTQDGQRAVLARSDGTFTVWNLATGSSVHTVAGQPLLAEALAALSERDGAIATVGVARPPEGVVAAIRRAAGRTGQGSAVGAVATTPDGTRAVSAAADTLTVWTMQAGEAVRTAQTTYKNTAAVAITADGRHVLYASPEGTVGTWDVEHGGTYTRGEREETPGAISVTPDGRRIVSGSWTGSLRVWDVESAKETHILGGHEGGVNAVVALPDGRRALSAADDATLRVWDLETGRELRSLTGHRSAVTAAVVCLGGRRAISASVGTLRLWDLETGKSVVVVAPGSHISSMAATPDGGTVIVGYGSGNLHALRYVSIEPS